MDKAAQKERLEAGLALGVREAVEIPVAVIPMRLRLMLKRLELLVPAFWNEAPSRVADTLAEENPALLEALSVFDPQTIGFVARTQRIVQGDRGRTEDR